MRNFFRVVAAIITIGGLILCILGLSGKEGYSNLFLCVISIFCFIGGGILFFYLSDDDSENQRQAKNYQDDKNTRG